MKNVNKLEFYRKTADCLGPPEFEPEVVEAHQRMTAEYFEQARLLLQRWGKNGLVVAQQEWLKPG